MTEKGRPHIVSQQYVFDSPGARKAWRMPTTDWQDLKDDVGKIDVPSPVCDGIGAGLVGVGITCVITALTVPKNSDECLGMPARGYWFAAFAITLVAGVMLLVIAYYRRRGIRLTKEDVLKQMERIERDNNPAYPEVEE